MKVSIPERGDCVSGTLLGGCKANGRDESGVATWQLRELIASVNGVNKDVLAEHAGVSARLVWRICSEDSGQPVVSLSVADRLILALGDEYTIDALAVIPMKEMSDAIRMAVYECLDENDVVQKTSQEIEARAIELLDLRELLLSDEPEERQVAIDILRGL